MCGICGVINLAGREPKVTRGRFVAMRESLSHRGPDDAGVFESPGVLLGHRRLIVLDPSPAGSQPMTTPDGRFTLLYNGELYNDRALRGALGREGVLFRSSCDTETVLHAVSRWGAAAGERMRGMYALALWDAAERTMLLGRDEFGMKPLHWAIAGQDLVFASEAHALFEHPGLKPEPDPAVVSSYISTVRETLGERTLFAGVRAVLPGAWLRFRVGEPDGLPRRPERSARSFSASEPGGVRDEVEASVRAHLRSDVPWCSLLSGGLDSTIVATVAAGEIGTAGGVLNTYVSGCPSAGEGLADDFGFARRAADAVGSRHVEVPVQQRLFEDAWREIVARTGLPMTTPNTVAIHAVASALRAEGHVVTLSGEGADELFGGYEMPLEAMARHIADTPGGAETDGLFASRATAWLQPGQKAELLDAELWADAGRDAEMVGAFDSVMRESLESARARHPEAGETALRLEAYLGQQRRLNLPGLLARLDAATMLASVEGRTPFADAVVAGVAGGLPMSEKFVMGADGPSRSKIALRDAFRGMVPAEIVERPKRSFPLPFSGWLGSAEQTVRSSGLVRRVYTPAAIELAVGDPAAWWHLAWPMANLAFWDARWWG